MLFMRVVEASAAVSQASARNAKIAHLADLFRALAPDEIETVVALLSGEPRQGRIGLGHAAISAVSGVRPADDASLVISEVDAALAALATIKGAGSTKARVQQLTALFSRATTTEQ